jgi:Uma2 family endonuclease
MLTDGGWPIPPQSGYRADDLFTLPGLPDHTELMDGSLVIVPPQSRFHATTASLLEQRLREQAPAALAVRREMAVILSGQTVAEPDVAVIDSSADQEDIHQSSYQPRDVVLAIEVVSPSSLERDRETKPYKYAQVGIPYYWRVERDGDQSVAYLFALNHQQRRFEPAGTQTGRIATAEPFEIDIDLTEAERL